MVQILPGIDEYLSKGLNDLGETISLFSETDRKTERAIRNMLLENPSLVQEFTDLEARAPGSLKMMGFGRMADLITKSPESVSQEVQRGSREDLVRTGQAQITGDRQRSEFVVQSFDRILGELGLPEDVMDAMRGAMGLPSTLEKESAERGAEVERAIQPANLANAATASLYAQNMFEAAQAGQNVEGPISEFVTSFMQGTDDPNVTASILQHPLLGPQFEKQWDLQLWEKNAKLQRDLTGLRATNVTAAMKNQIAMISDLQGTAAEVSRLLGEYPQGVGLKFLGPEVLNARLDPEGVRLRAAIAGLSSTLFHLRSGTAVTANEKARLEPLTPNRWDTAESINSKLEELNRFFTDYVRNRTGQLNDMEDEETSSEEMALNDPNYVITADMTQDDLTRMVDMMIQRGMSSEEIKEDLVNFGVIARKGAAK